MKKIIISMMAGAMLVFCGNFAQAREESKDVVDKQAQNRSTRTRRPAGEKNVEPEAVNRIRSAAGRERTGRRGRDMMMDKRRASIQKQIEQKNKVHKAFIGRLNAIRNQAEKEGAKKTVVMLGNLIAMEEKKTAESIKKLVKDKEQIAGQIERYERPGKVQAAEEKKAEVEAKVKKAEEPKPAEGEKKKKKKWWKFGKD